MQLAVVTGSNRGIGHALVKSLLSLNPQLHVVAAARDPLSFPDVHEDRVITMELDVTREDSIRNFAKEVKKLDRKVRVLFNNAGVLNPEKTLLQCNQEEVMRHFQTNTIGPLLVSKYFVEEGLLADKVAKLSDPFKVPSIIANMSARSGSLEENKLGGWYSYRASKAALNQVTKTLAAELGRKGIITVSLHPGTVETDMSAFFIKNLKGHTILTPENSAKDLVNVLTRLTVEDNGKFLDHEMKPIPW